MKSLKRTLCLVLALVMVLGLFGIASATSFTDDNTIQYKEAVDVMTGIGAISGYTDGTFNPKGTITRAEAAKLVTYTVLGKDAAERLTGVTSSFTDVTTAGGYGWAIPSIEYLVKLGVINGRGDGTFDPKGNITGYEVGKMLLCALGYGAKSEYTGNGWDFQVAVDGGKYGVFANRAANAAAMSSPATREEVALYCFNTIQLDRVQYISTLDIYSKTGVSKIIDAVYAGQETNGLKKAAFDAQSNPGKDPFGAPANVWTYKGKPIGAYPVGDVITYTAKKTVTDVTSDLRGYTIASAAVSENGKTGTPITAIASIAGLTGNGTVVRVYADATNKINNVVVVKTDVAKVTAIDAARKTVTLTTETSGAISAQPLPVIQSDSKFYNTVAGLAVDDFVLVTLKVDTAGANPEIVSVTVPTQVTGKVTTVNNATNTVYLDGTKPYGKAATATTAVGTIGVDTEHDAILWLDSYGYVVNSKATAATASKFAYVLDTYATLSNGKLEDMAKVVYSNGTTADIGITNTYSGISAGLHTITGPVNGEYTLATLVAGDTGTASGHATNLAKDKYLALTQGGKINAYDKALTAWTQSNDGSATNYFPNYYSASVKFIYVKDKTATVVEGVQTVASIPANSVAIVEENSDAAKTPVVTAVILPGANPSAIDSSKLVYLPFNASHNSGTPDGSVDMTHTLIAVPIAKTALLDSSTNKYVEVPVYNGYVNGVQQTTGIPSSTTGADAVTGIANYNAAGFYTMAADKSVAGRYELIAYTEATGETAVKTNENITSAFETILTIDGVAIQTANATFVDVRTADQQNANPVILSAKGVAAAVDNNTINVSVVYNAKTGVASMVYINSVASAPTTYTITNSSASVEAKTGGLTYTIGVDKTSAAENATVTITVNKPTNSSGATGNDTLTISVKKADNSAVTLSGTQATGWVLDTTAGTVKIADLSALPSGNQTVTFTMPASNVTISVNGVHAAA